MRNGSIAVLREIEETGGSNVQWAINPEDGRMVVIEMNPRVSRSSALHQKRLVSQLQKSPRNWRLDIRWMNWTMTLPRLRPRIEPTIDYVVTKIPRFAFENSKV